MTLTEPASFSTAPKGLRPITQAAFSISLMEYCVGNDSAHPGFLILDSPLLSYKEPEGPEDDL